MTVLLLLEAVLVSPALGQEPAPGGTPPPAGQPPTPAQPPPPGQLPPPATPTLLTPVPVIPDVAPFPPSTVPSAPQQVLPVGLVPTATFTLLPSVTLSEEYTDNFNLNARNKESNFRTSLSPGLRLLINTPLTKGIIGYTFSPSHDSADGDINFFHSLLGQVTWDATPRWRLTVADALTRSDRPEQADSLGLRRDRQTFTTNTFSLASDYLIGTVVTSQSYRWTIFSSSDGSDTSTHNVAASATLPIYQTNSLFFGYDYLISDSSGGSQATAGRNFTSSSADTSGHQFTAAFSRQFTSLLSGGLRGSYALRNRTDDTGGDLDYRLWNVSVFTGYTLPGSLVLNASVGVSGITTDAETLGPNFFTASSITYQFGPAVATLAVNQGFSETFTGGQNFGVVETLGVTGTLTYAFTPLVTGTARGFFTRNETTGIGNTVSGRDNTDENWGGSLAFSYRIRSNIVLDLSYNYRRHMGSQNGNADADYSENRVRASASFSF